MEAEKDHRQLALDCLEMVRIAKNPELRVLLLALAGKWLDLADEDAATQAVRGLLESMKRSG